MPGKRIDPLYQAQAILSRRDHSEAEVRLKMKRKGFGQEQIDSAVGWLYKHNLLDDDAFARRYIESAVALKPVGRKWLAMKLRQRGISGEQARRAIDEVVSEEKEQQLLKQAAASWKRSHPKYKDDTHRLGHFLLSRGFSFEKVSAVIE